VDEQNKRLEPLPRHLVHQKGYWHRTTHIWLKHPIQGILCHQRARTITGNPGKWSAYFGGHLGANTEYAVGALIELQEELGMTFEPQCLTILY
jgi:isopentenyl-diphosphate delta-isomerase